MQTQQFFTLIEPQLTKVTLSKGRIVYKVNDGIHIILKSYGRSRVVDYVILRVFDNYDRSITLMENLEEYEDYYRFDSEFPYAFVIAKDCFCVKEQEELEQHDVEHIDDWLDDVSINNEEDYARFVLDYFRLPAAKQIAYAPYMEQFELFCTFENFRYRVTGASRMGDILLAKNPKQQSGYDKRVAVTKCNNWSNKFEWDVENATT